MSKLHEMIIAYYDATAQAYKKWGGIPEKGDSYALHYGYFPEGEEIDHFQSLRNHTQKVIDLAQIQPNHIVLDAGCGTGDLSLEIARRYPDAKVFGITLSLHQAATAHRSSKELQLTNTYFATQDFCYQGFPDNFFDRVVFCESLGYAPDKKKLLKEVKRVLKSGGLLTIADGFFNGEELTEEQNKNYELLKQGWVLPNLVTINNFYEWLREFEFRNIILNDVTENILPSSKYMMNLAEARLETSSSTVSALNKLACIAQYYLFSSRTLGYYFISTEVKKA